MKEKVKNFYIQNILELRSKRASRLIFLSKNFSIVSLSKIFLQEIVGNYKKADDLLVLAILNDLIEKKILAENPVDLQTYSVGLIKYYDVRLKTSDNRFYCRGTSVDLSEAFAKSFGEVFERSTIKLPTDDEIIYKSVAEIKNKKEFIDFNLLPKAAEAQLDKFPNFRILENDIFSFVETERLADNKKIYVPAQTIFFGEFAKTPEKRIIQSTTHGAGAGFSNSDSYRSCLFEIIHRHFFLNSWYHKQKPKKINLESIPKNSKLSEKIQNFRSQGFKIYFLDFTPEATIPTTICILEKSGFYCGGSTSFTIASCLERALDEAFSTYLWTIYVTVGGKNTLTQKFIDDMQPGILEEKVGDFERLLIFGNSYYKDMVDKFFIEGEEVTYSDMFDQDNKIDLKKLGTIMFGPDIFVYNKKSQILTDYNYFVTKVFIPNSYYFPLKDTFARPLLNGDTREIYPEINPFP